MQPIQYSQPFLRKRKFLLMLPLLILPFLILLFAALGGGKEIIGPLSDNLHGGLNVKIPDAHFKKGAEKSKLSLYEEAGRDSVKMRDRIKNDPYYLLQHPDKSDMSLDSSKMPEYNEARIMEKLAQLKSVIHQKTSLPDPDQKLLTGSEDKRSAIEKLLSSQKTETTHDPRMDQLTAMLDKVMAIQHPEILQDSMMRLAKEHAIPTYPVSLNKPLNEPQTFGSEDQEENQTGRKNRFYDLAASMVIENDFDNGIEAVVPETQILVSGSTIKLRLLNDVRINGHLIGKNQFIYGTTSLSNERLKIQFSSIRTGNNILPVSLEAYDMDGLAGIYIPGSINRDVAKQSTDQAFGSISVNSLDPSVAAQAAGAGIQAAKTLLSRKVKLIKVTVKAGYKILLKDSKDK